MSNRAKTVRHSAWVIAVVALAWVSVTWVQAIQQIEPQPNPLIRPTAGWDTKRSEPTDPNFYLPDYPIAFVRVPVVEFGTTVCNTFNPPYNCAKYYSGQPCSNGGTPVSALDSDYHMGTDVNSANDPSPGNELWIYLPETGGVKKLFPRPIHDTTNVIDFTPDVGSVVEPNVSEDGTKIYFAYYQDALHGTQNESDGSSLPLSGSDLYVIDVGPLLTNPSTNPDTLIVTRLTTRQYNAGTSQQTLADRNLDAMNQANASATTWQPYNYGTSYLHPIEVRTRNGLFLAYISDKRRLENANPSMNRANHNFNLHLARIEANGTLGLTNNQFQYYTTTGALSPAPLRNGLSFSFQSTTEDARMWHIQGMDSEGHWYPILGYGSNPELYHLASFCASSSGDYLVATRYYNANNEAFGSLWKQSLDPAVLGKNTYTNVADSHHKVPYQVGSTELTNPPGTSLSSDYPSPINQATGQYYGKFTAPRCGGVDELYFSYSPTSATSNLYDTQCNRGLYHAYIGFRPNLDPWTPGLGGPNGHRIVIRKSNGDSSLMWATPVVRWDKRTNGDVTQQFSPSIATPSSTILPGEPFAIVGSSDLGNTDRRPFECYMVQNASGAPAWYTPWGVWNVNQENDLIADNQDGWTYVGPPGPGNNFCVPPDRSKILGIAVNVTSNKSNLAYNFGYQNSSGPYPPKKEATRLLGFYSTRGQPDQSFRALIPANVPFEFQAIDKDYGMKLTDHRGWHTVKPQESRTDCLGCHQHNIAEQPTQWDPNMYALTHAPVDMVRSTPSISYDANCQVHLDPPDTAAAQDYPEWRADIWPQMDANCGSCHNTSTGNGTGVAALSWANTSQAAGDGVYDQLVNRQFASTQRGALGSQLFWAVRGQRTDGRSNTAYPADYDCSTALCQNNTNHPGYRWGFYYSAQHDALANNCTTGLPGYAAWAFNVGKWIDNHMPRDTGYPKGYKYDWYHPTADSAISTPDCALTQMRVGWWDDSNQLKSVKVWVNTNEASPLYSQVWPGSGPAIANGSATFNLPTLSYNDTIAVEVRDLVDNRQVYRKRVDELQNDCVVPGGNPQPGP